MSIRSMFWCVPLWVCIRIALGSQISRRLLYRFRDSGSIYFKCQQVYNTLKRLFLRGVLCLDYGSWFVSSLSSLRSCSYPESQRKRIGYCDHLMHQIEHFRFSLYFSGLLFCCDNTDLCSAYQMMLRGFLSLNRLSVFINWSVS